MTKIVLIIKQNKHQHLALEIRLLYKVKSTQELFLFAIFILFLGSPLRRIYFNRAVTVWSAEPRFPLAKGFQ